MAKRLDGFGLLAIAVVHNESVNDAFARELFLLAQGKGKHSGRIPVDEFVSACDSWQSNVQIVCDAVPVECDELPQLGHTRKPRS